MLLHSISQIKEEGSAPTEAKKNPNPPWYPMSRRPCYASPPDTFRANDNQREFMISIKLARQQKISQPQKSAKLKQRR